MGADPVPPAVKSLLYVVLNVSSACGIVFANKVVFQVYAFKFTSALTFIHTIFTLVGMRLFCHFGVFERKGISKIRLMPLAGAYVSYIVFCNLNLNVNSVGFYQISKIAVAPTVLLMELMTGKRFSRKTVASVVMVCFGVTLSTVTDKKMSTNVIGVGIGLLAVCSTALYQILAGSTQKKLKAGSMQLLHEYTPLAALLLALVVPVMEPMGWKNGAPDTLLGYQYNLHAVLAILFSAALGLLVSLSTFLVIGATSSLTYNIVGHMKTIIILTGGYVYFGDDMSAIKLLGIIISLSGVVWYAQTKVEEANAAALPNSPTSKSEVPEGKV